MVQLAPKLPNPLNIRHAPARDRPERRHEHVRLVVDLLLLLLATTRGRVRAADADAPLAGGGVPLRADDLVRELDVPRELVLVDDVLEVRLDLVARGVQRRPVALRVG